MKSVHNNITTQNHNRPAKRAGIVHSLACVSFLNSKPLIDPLVGREDVEIHFAVPSSLLPLLESNAVSTGLLSIVDYQASVTDLLLVPAGMIGCDGPTHTVRIFSRVPIDQIKTLHGDTDSHTSIILAQLILREQYGVTPAVVPLNQSESSGTYSAFPSLLLIGDKVVNAAPDASVYMHQLDLGIAWKKLTGLPFVFAMWMMRKDHALARETKREAQQLARLLADARRRGATMTDQLLDRYAAEKSWPRDLARRYFTQYLRYEVTPAARQGLAHFFQRAQHHELLAFRRAPEYFE